MSVITDPLPAATGERWRVPGWAWMVASALLFAGMATTVRQLVAVVHANVYWVAWIRLALGVLVVAVPVLVRRGPRQVHNRRAFVGRGVFGVAAMVASLVAIDKVGLGRGAVLAQLAALCATLAAIPLLRERPRPVLAAAVVAATLGILLCSATGVPRGWEWLPLAGAVCGGLAWTYIRLLRRTDNNRISLFSQSVFGVCLLLPWLPGDQWPATPTVWALILVMATCDILGQFCLSHGLGQVPVATGGALLLLVPVLCLLAGVICFGEQLCRRQWAGCAVVLAAGMLAVCARAPAVATPRRPDAVPLPPAPPLRPALPNQAT